MNQSVSLLSLSSVLSLKVHLYCLSVCVTILGPFINVIIIVHGFSFVCSYLYCSPVTTPNFLFSAKTKAI